MASVNWSDAIKPLLKKYKGTKHPLDYGNVYQLIVMVVLSAQDSDKHINQIASKFFKTFPDMKALSKSTPEILSPLISDVRNFGNKAKWLSEIGKAIKSDKDIPLTLDGLTALPGIGRKSANVI
jgi:endonuclease-3